MTPFVLVHIIPTNCRDAVWLKNVLVREHLIASAKVRMGIVSGLASQEDIDRIRSHALVQSVTVDMQRSVHESK